MHLKSGEFIAAAEIEDDGAYPVYGGNGLRGFTENWNTSGPIVLIGRQGALCGNVQIVSGKAWVSEHALRCFPEKPLNVSFLRYALQSLKLGQYSVSAAQPGLSTDNLKPLLLPFPSPEIQRQIAAFLDEKTAQIDGLIAKKQALLDRLAEKRQAIITQAVTKGLNPATPMKDSGIDWLGQVPAHWTLLPLGRSVFQIEQGWSPQCEERQKEETEWGVLRSGCVNEGVFRPHDHKTLPADLDPRPFLEVRAGDLLMCRASGSLHLIGSAALVEDCPPRMMFSDKTYRIRLSTDVADARFVALALGAKYMREQIILSVSGAGGLANNIPQAQVKKYEFVRPPVGEQQQIAQIVSARLRKMEEVTRTVDKSVQSLSDYRSALITAAVTGQIEGLR
ncbi:MAG: restriction endonuclease subunit S [Terracidiphilus sp.]